MTAETPSRAASPEGFRDRFETLIPTIQREWPAVARQTLEATRGSFDEVVEVISSQTGRTASAVKVQLLDLLEVAGDQTSRLADNLAPLEAQLENLLDELNTTLRPRIEKPVRERPLMAIGIVPVAARATTPVRMASAIGALAVWGRSTEASSTRNSVLRFRAAI
ncbi:MAG: hypothetical protein NWR94_02510 [Cyanobium sp. MAG_237]|nr:hypothetical protein [Cyanobium sp. MAG_237]